MLTPPRPERRPSPRFIHGSWYVDDYQWMADGLSQDVEALIDAENAYTNHALAELGPLIDALDEEMWQRTMNREPYPPSQVGDYEYLQRTPPAARYPVYLRKPRNASAAEEILLDLNALFPDHPYVGLGGLHVSPDGRTLVYLVDTSGERDYTLVAKCLVRGQVFYSVFHVAPGVAWQNDSRAFYYVCQDQSRRPFLVKYHALSAAPVTDVTVFEEREDTRRVLLSKSRDDKYVLIASDGQGDSAWWAINASRPKLTPTEIITRSPGVECTVDHCNEVFVVLSSDGGRNRRVIVVPDKEGRSGTRELLTHDASTLREQMLAFASGIVTLERTDGRPQIRVTTITEPVRSLVLQFDERACHVVLANNHWYWSEAARFLLTTPLRPPRIIDVALNTGETRTVWEARAVGDSWCDTHDLQRETAISRDGTAVPMTIVMNRTACRNGTGAAIVSVYGGYGVAADTSWRSEFASALDRGCAVVIAHVRGGRDCGQEWYESVRGKERLKAVEDFIAVVDHVVASGVAAGPRVAVWTGSAGGVVVGAALNMRPQLCGAVVAERPFVDIVNTLLDRSLPLTTTDWAEWGNPADEEVYRSMRSYSPYDNVRPAEYPAMLVTASLHDSQVAFWEPLKWVARLRACSTNPERIHLIVDRVGGHAGPAGRRALVRQRARLLAFVLNRLEAVRLSRGA